MHSFKDKNGKTWYLEVTIPVLMKLRASLDFDILRIDDPDVMSQFADMIVVAKVLYCMAGDEPEKCGISETEFYKVLDGEALNTGQHAMLRTIVDFFHEGRRVILAEALTKMEAAEQVMLDHAKKMINQSTVESLAAQIMPSATATGMQAS